MPKVRNVSGSDVTLYDGRFVADDGVVEVSARDFEMYDWDQPDNWVVLEDIKPARKAEKE